MPEMLLAQANSLDLPLRDGSVHCVATSPPYYGLRVYQGVEPTCWPGGSYAPVPGAPPIVIPGPTVEDMAACRHEWGGWQEVHDVREETLHGKPRTTNRYYGDPSRRFNGNHQKPMAGATCLRCGCWYGTYGNEETPARYVWHTLLWLMEVKRVLRDDGCCWVVIGDAFSSGDRQGHGTRVGDKQQTNRGMNGTADPPRVPQPDGYAQGCLLGIPQQVLLAAIADGWIVRNDAIWAKNSPMPESVSGWRWQQARCQCVVPHVRRQQQVNHNAHGHNGAQGMNVRGDLSPQPDPNCQDCRGTGRLAEEVLRQGSWRHTRSHETVLMLTKTMGYWSNGEAVREEAVAGWNGSSFTSAYDHQTKPGLGKAQRIEHAGRNPRSVLTPKAASFVGDHYATFPPALIEPLIRATCPERCCLRCGQAWAPSITHRSHQQELSWSGSNRQNGCLAGGGHTGRTGQWSTETVVHGLRPTCSHYCTCTPPQHAVFEAMRADVPLCPQCGKLPLSDWQPGLVLDPFAGSGTTLLVARVLGRRAIGTDLSGYYLREEARTRLGMTALAAWEGRNGHQTPQTFTDLPLFATREEQTL